MCDHRRALLATVCQFGDLLFFFYQGCGVQGEEEQQKLCS